MRRKTFERMRKKVHEINLGELGTEIVIKKLKPLLEQTNFNSMLDEWHGPKEWEVVVQTKGEIDAFKESEDWKEIGTITIHDYKCKINDNLLLQMDDISHYMVQRLDNMKHYEVIFYREFIGETHLGLRPVIGDVF
jgi:hypothetical protein